MRKKTMKATGQRAKAGRKLILLGVICKSNYKAVHDVWHAMLVIRLCTSQYLHTWQNESILLPDVPVQDLYVFCAFIREMMGDKHWQITGQLFDYLERPMTKFTTPLNIYF